MNLFDYDKAYRESLAVFEALRKLGFSADDIYFMVSGFDNPKKVINPSLKGWVST